MTDTSKSPSNEVDDLRNQLEVLRATDPAPLVAEAKQRAADTVSKVANTVTDTVVPPIRYGVERVQDAAATARRTAAQVRAQKETLSHRVRTRPFAALAVSVLSGYVFGRIVR